MKIDIPGYKILSLDYLVLDYNGTIAADGVVPDDMKERLRALADRFRIYVVTADTHGNARSECEGLPIAVMDAEGMYDRLAAEADVCARSMQEGLDLLMNEKRLIATLRG